MHGSDPKQYMELVNSLRSGNFDKRKSSDIEAIEPDEWFSHFSSLLGKTIQKSQNDIDMETFFSQNVDLFSETWGSNFTPVIKTLQSMLNSTYYSNTSKKDQSILESLPVGKRLAMKLLLPLAHSCVANREASKSLLIRTVGQFNYLFTP